MVALTIPPGKLELIANELYSPAHAGTRIITDVLPLDFRLALLEQLRQGPFTQVPPIYHNSVQDFSRFGEDTHALESLPESAGLIKELAAAHAQFYDCLGHLALFEPTAKITYSAHHFPLGSFGISTHRDELRYRNLIAIYVISGNRQFHAGKTREEIAPLENPPGSVILLRAPRKKGEGKLRPYHCVTTPATERYTLSFRHTL